MTYLQLNADNTYPAAWQDNPVLDPNSRAQNRVLWLNFCHF